MKTIAISGKGGTGKTTLAAFIIRLLKDHKAKSVLAVDADPNVNLNDLLGVELKDTIGAIREEMKILANNLPGGMTKQRFLEYKIQSSLVETPDFDLIAMGRPEGPGCYCYANNLLREILGALSANYEYVVIDNQAGMEHLSRQNVQAIDYLLIVSDPSLRGIRAAARISQLIKELDARVKKKYIVLNRIHCVIEDQVKKAIEEEGLELIHSIHEDEQLLKLDQAGKTVFSIRTDSPVYRSVNKLLMKLIDSEAPIRGDDDF